MFANVNNFCFIYISILALRYEPQNWAQVHPVSIDHPWCCYNLIEVHLWWIQLIGHDLERHTPVYIRSHSWQCMSQQKPSHEVEGIVHRALRQDCVKEQIWGRVPNIFGSIERPKNTVASKWKKFGTTKTLPRAGRPAKLSNRWRRALVREVTQNPMVTLTELHSSSVEMGEPSRRTTISATLHQSGRYGGQTEATPQ